MDMYTGILKERVQTEISRARVKDAETYTDLSDGYGLAGRSVCHDDAPPVGHVQLIFH